MSDDEREASRSSPQADPTALRNERRFKGWAGNLAVVASASSEGAGAVERPAPAPDYLTGRLCAWLVPGLEREGVRVVECPDCDALRYVVPVVTPVSVELRWQPSATCWHVDELDRYDLAFVGLWRGELRRTVGRPRSSPGSTGYSARPEAPNQQGRGAK